MVEEPAFHQRPVSSSHVRETGLLLCDLTLDDILFRIKSLGRSASELARLDRFLATLHVANVKQSISFQTQIRSNSNRQKKVKVFFNITGLPTEEFKIYYYYYY